ncbi:GNAT family N-acetyltransferase [Rickettsiales bacterium]|jgi:GNAT superfamily N-acetyltransferase|nr:GNAT family N-acetyltransferase [Rickettsiales bacterium]|tara:strand:- start:7964 stop:8401 length:438 start_codon:yes stop_codon:yes gene_type:complete
MQIKEINSREDIEKSYKILSQIYDNLNNETYVDDVLNMMQRGYKMAHVIEDEDIDNGRSIGVIGVRITRKLMTGKTLEIEDFMIDRKKRGIGVGKMLLRWAEWQAAVFKCQNITSVLESKREESQRIFSREGLNIQGVLFGKESS